MTEDQAGLVRKAEASLQAAKSLAEQGYIDFAVSRAYYTMFYVAQAFLLINGLIFSKHSAVISSFGRDFAHAGRVPVEFHRHLIEAEVQRNAGDYHIKSTLTPADAALQIERAEAFLTLAQNFL